MGNLIGKFPNDDNHDLKASGKSFAQIQKAVEDYVAAAAPVAPGPAKTKAAGGGGIDAASSADWHITPQGGDWHIVPGSG